MTMTYDEIEKKTVYLCDKCGKEVSSRRRGLEWYTISTGWTGAVCAHDICSECYKKLNKWLKRKPQIRKKSKKKTKKVEISRTDLLDLE